MHTSILVLLIQEIITNHHVDLRYHDLSGGIGSAPSMLFVDRLNITEWAWFRPYNAI